MVGVGQGRETGHLGRLRPTAPSAEQSARLHTIRQRTPRISSHLVQRFSSNAAAIAPAFLTMSSASLRGNAKRSRAGK